MEIKIYKKLTCIKTFDGVLRTPMSCEEIDSVTERSKFINIGGVRIAVHQIKSYGEEEVSDMDGFILSKEKSVQEKLNAILEERKRNGFPTKGIEHLRDIYMKRHG